MPDASTVLMDLLDLRPGADLDTLADSLRNSLKMVILTQAEYDALVSPDENTLYVTIEE